MRFYVGICHVHTAGRVRRAFVSINSLQRRRSGFPVNDWILDSGAFTQVSTLGTFAMSVDEYVRAIARWSRCGRLEMAVAQDWMCEPHVLARTGATVAEHQARTIERYDQLVRLAPAVQIMPVLQGWTPAEYAQHVRDYGARLAPGARVGVGSVCRRQGRPGTVCVILEAIMAERPDLRLHGFGLKLTTLLSGDVCSRLWSADSMAWSYAARRQRGLSNRVEDALEFVHRIETGPMQYTLFDRRAEDLEA